MSSATVVVRSVGFFWLNPVAMVLFMLCSAVVVERLLLKPWCVDMCGMLFVMYGSSGFSSVLLLPREVRWVCMMCLCSCLCLVVELEWCLLVSMYEGWCCCLVMCCTCWWGMRVQVVLRAWGVWCWFLSGPVELLSLLCFIAAWTCVVGSVMLVVYSLRVFLSMCLFVLCVLCLTVLVNCLLHAFAICVGEVNVFSLKVMVLFLGCVFFVG